MIDLSIIIPIYNVDKYLRACLDSVATSIEEALASEMVEVILVDDGSTDTSGIICDDYANKHSYISVIHQSNSGVAVARNQGLCRAAGQYVYFVDSDDELTNNCVSDIINEVHTEVDDYDVLLFDGIKASDSRTEEWSHFTSDFATYDANLLKALQAGVLYFPVLKNCKLSDDNISYRTSVPLAAPWDKVYKRTLLINNDICFGESLKVLDDMIFNMEVFGVVQSLKYIKKKIYRYRYVSDSITHAYKMDRVDKDITVWEYIDNYLNNSGATELLKQAYNLRVVKSFSISLKLQMFNSKNNASLVQKLKYVKQVLKMPYYKEAFANADISKAEWMLRPMILFGRMQFTFGIYLLYLGQKLL